MMSDSISEEDKRDYINEVKQGIYDSKVEDHLSSMKIEDIAGTIRFNSDCLAELFDRHIFPTNNAEAWINEHAEVLAEMWVKRDIIFGLLSQQMEGNLLNEAEAEVDNEESRL